MLKQQIITKTLLAVLFIILVGCSTNDGLMESVDSSGLGVGGSATAEPSDIEPIESPTGVTGATEVEPIGASIPVTIAKAYIDPLGISIETIPVEDILSKVLFDILTMAVPEAVAEDDLEDEYSNINIVGHENTVVGENPVEGLLGDESGNDMDQFFSNLNGSIDPLPLKNAWLDNSIQMELLGAEESDGLDIVVSSSGKAFYIGFQNEGTDEIVTSTTFTYNDFAVFYTQTELESGLSEYKIMYQNLHGGPQQEFLTSSFMAYEPKFSPTSTHLGIEYPAHIWGITEDGQIVLQSKIETKYLNPFGFSFEQQPEELLTSHAPSHDGFLDAVYTKRAAGHIAIVSLAGFSYEEMAPVKTSLDPIISGRSMEWLTSEWSTSEMMSFTFYKPKNTYTLEDAAAFENIFREVIQRETEARVVTKEDASRSNASNNDEVTSNEKEGENSNSIFVEAENNAVKERRLRQLTRLYYCIKDNPVCSSIDNIDLGVLTSELYAGTFDPTLPDQLFTSDILHTIPRRIFSPASTSLDENVVITEPYIAGLVRDTNGDQVFMASHEAREMADGTLKPCFKKITEGSRYKGKVTVSKDGLFLAFEAMAESGQRIIKIVDVKNGGFFNLLPPRDFPGSSFFAPKFSSETFTALAFLVSYEGGDPQLAVVNLRNHPMLKHVIDGIEENPPLEPIKVFQSCQEAGTLPSDPIGSME